MSVAVTSYNYARVWSSIPVTDPSTFDTTWTCRYVVGYKPVSGPIVYYSHPSFQGPAVGQVVVVACSHTQNAQAQFGAIQSAIATQEGLNLAGGDTVEFGPL